MKLTKKRMQLMGGVFFLIVLAALCAWFIIQKKWWSAIATVPFMVYIIFLIINIAEKTDKLILEFIEAIQYKDYSRNYNTGSVAGNMRLLLAGLNSINENFKSLSRQKAAENTYLHTVFEMVGIGIFSYQENDGSIIWMNEAFKKITGIPYAKNIHAIQARNELLFTTLQSLSSGQKNILTINNGIFSEKILINATVFSSNGNINKLFSLQNIHEALDENEAASWQKLLNVMTHEIMNSVAPISSLADTLKTQLEKSNGHESLIEREDLALGLETIKKRSEGLQRFAITYRHLNKISKPVLQKVFVRDLFANLQTLMQPTFNQKNIELDVILKEPQLTILADASLMEQVLINLITNAIEAVKQNPAPVITLSAYYENEKPFIKVTDNGVGIPQDIAGQIFVPFFSTRKNGNGIGLSLCKQIMLLHKGSIQMKSHKGSGSAFILQF